MTPSKLQRETKKYQKYSYGSEQGCDVVFMVGTEERWRLPAHKQVLQEANLVFHVMLSESYEFANDYPIDVPDVDARAFDNLLRFLYGEAVNLQSWQTALETLRAAHKYQCPDLVHLCVEFLSMKIDHSNVLCMLSYVQVLCVDYENLENINRENKLGGSTNNKNMKKPLPRTINGQSESLNSIEEKCSILLQICLCFVDSEASTILRSDEMEDLDSATMKLILSRDTLYINDELIAFTALRKWADKECKRKQLPLIAKSMRAVLGDLLFLPRYLTMSRTSFEKGDGPAQSGLFTKEELTALKKIISGARYEINTPNSSVHQTNNPYNSHIVQPPSTLCPFIRLMNTPREPRSFIINNTPRKRSFSLLERIKGKRGGCCRRSSSLNSTPANSNQSSPVRRGNQSQNPSQPVSPRRGNTVVENIFIFLACLFD